MDSPEPTIEELRQWSAKLMGWEIRQKEYNYLYFTGSFYDRGDGTLIESSIYVKDWQPDDCKTGQIWLVVERMRELRWRFEFYYEFSETTFFGTPVKSGWIAKFVKHSIGRATSKNDPCHAILLAAWRAMEGK